MTAHEIIIRPIVSEQSYDMMEQNKYTFEVAKSATKLQVRDAIEEIFGVHVTRVNTLNVKPKTKRVRYIAGKTRTWKKAIVTVAEGETIEIFGTRGVSTLSSRLLSPRGDRGVPGLQYGVARYRGKSGVIASAIPACDG